MVNYPLKSQGFGFFRNIFAACFATTERGVAQLVTLVAYRFGA
jgi:hypothetical protein